MTQMVRAPMSELETLRFLKNGQKPMLTDDEKEQHRMKALLADQWANWYAFKAQDADYPEDRELWKRREAHHRLECQLHLSILEEEDERV